MSFFENVLLAPPDPILGLTTAFVNDPRENKVNLGAGIYKTESLKTPILEAVKLAESYLLEEEKTKEYLPIQGEPHYLEHLGELVFGEEIWSKEKSRIARFQTVGGTGALKIGGTFLKEEADGSVWIPSPTWPNHKGVFTHCGLKVQEYPYFDKMRKALDFENWCDQLEKMPSGSIVMLHASCHNPTGHDPSDAQWHTLCSIFQRKKLIPFFDSAYQGFGRGLEEDVKNMQHFLRHGMEMLVAVSNAKNLSLYGERVGALFIVSSSAKVAEKISSRVKQMIRVIYSNPPKHGAVVAAMIFKTPSLRKKWIEELAVMRERIQSMRLLLTEMLGSKSDKNHFNSIAKGMGMFAYTGLNSLQVEKIRKEYGIYMSSDGRINVCGLNRSNITIVAKALEENL